MNQEKVKAIKEIKERINKLPKGYISIKEINGNIYYYHQWSIDGKKQSKYITGDELASLNNQIEERQKLEEQLKIIKKGYETSNVLSCSLMHINIKVIDLKLSRDTGLIIDVGNIYSFSHLPVGTTNNKNELNKSDLIDWWNNRSIPLTRSGIREALEKLNISVPTGLLTHCHGLSLSDQYWIKIENEDTSWEDINFFDNDFSNDVGEILLGNNRNKKELNLSSPDNTSVGNLKKRWAINNRMRVMIKGGSNPFRQEPYNEVIVSLIAKELGINCVSYSLIYENDYPYSVCDNFINKNNDLVTAYQINKVLKKNNSDSVYTHLIKCSEYLGIKNVKEFFDQMIVLDYITANEDRHLNNFGFIRDASTLSFISPSPIYDNGSSFGFDKITDDIKAFKNITLKPFKENILEHINLVSSFKWVSVDKLLHLKETIKDSFSSYESRYLDKQRINAITSASIERIDYLLQLIENKNKHE